MNCKCEFVFEVLENKKDASFFISFFLKQRSFLHAKVKQPNKRNYVF